MGSEIHVNGEVWWGIVSMANGYWTAYKDTDPTRALHVVLEDVEVVVEDAPSQEAPL